MNDVMQEIKDKVESELYEHLGFDEVDGTYIYCLTRVKEAFHVGTMTLDDFVEVDGDFVGELVDLFLKLYSALLERLEEATETLEEYANPENWRLHHVKKEFYQSWAHVDSGELAESTLKRIKGENN
jgi:hypothetical protein